MAMITGTSGDDALTGTPGDDIINGLGGNDIIDGGFGADQMHGGTGDDTYFVDDPNDKVFEAYGEGNDTVKSSADFVIGGQYIENVVLIGSGNVKAVGNGQNNTLTGNGGDNLLNGGAGADHMAGGAGNDTYYVDNAGDTVTEAVNQGTDTVFSSLDYVLGANVENLVLQGTAVKAAGNSLDNTLIGNAGNNTLNGMAGADIMQGGAGNDIYYVDNAGDKVIEAYGGGYDTVYSSIDYVLGGQYIEKVILTGSAIKAGGNGLNNFLVGNANNNILNGNGGADIMQGGLGDDTYYVDNPGDTVTELAGQGTDLVNSSISYTLGANVENLTLTGAGNISATGNDLDNVIHGNSGNNLIDGGLGADTMAGGAGNDTYVVDNPNDAISESANGGTDTVWSSITFTVSGTNIENITLTGTADINAFGNKLANTLTGNSGNNLLDGGNEGSLVDHLAGGAGDDTYDIYHNGDVVTENPGEGHDLVIALFQQAASYILPGNVEDLQVTAPGGSITGNGLDNVMTASSGNNQAFHINGGNGDDTITTGGGNDVLDGGTGADTVAGGGGNDLYLVDNPGDVVIEASDGGADQIQSSVSYTLPDNVEYLTLTGPGDTNATGNGLDNILNGNSGNNVMDGAGGADQMYGGPGDDTYYVDNSGDFVYENAGNGTDLVIASINYTLGQNLENLTLAGTDNLNATGNALDNVLTGNAGNNILDGKAGADSMTGGAGDDTYYVDNNGDVVTENANEGTDLVEVSTAAYTLPDNVENADLVSGYYAHITGNDLDNVITASGSYSFIDGGLGADTMIGGAYDDTFVVDNVNDVVIDNGVSKHDLVESYVSYTLPGNVENLTLMGTDDLHGTGNDLNNVIVGNSGDNLLDGGKGGDDMTGGTGNDTYYVDNAADRVHENSGEGNDVVYTSVNFTVGANEIETVIFNGSGDVTLTGGDATKSLVGGDGNDTLTSGSGITTLDGGQGNDTYFVNNPGDVVTEQADHGTDTVYTIVSYTLGANVENLQLEQYHTSYTTSYIPDINGTGNALDNVIGGNDGNNLIDGGMGADTMSGGKGNDTYVVDNAGDVVVENFNEGTDTVESSISYQIGANVENLTLIGTGNIYGIGDGGDNVITGNDGNNNLTGHGGADTFMFETGNSADLITDYSAGEGDRINIHDYTNGIADGSLIHQSGTDTVIDLGGGNTITILDTTATDSAFLASIIW